MVVLQINACAAQDNTVLFFSLFTRDHLVFSSLFILYCYPTRKLPALLQRIRRKNEKRKVKSASYKGLLFTIELSDWILQSMFLLHDPLLTETFGATCTRKREACWTKTEFTLQLYCYWESKGKRWTSRSSFAKMTNLQFVQLMPAVFGIEQFTTACMSFWYIMIIHLILHFYDYTIGKCECRTSPLLFFRCLSWEDGGVTLAGWATLPRQW